MSDQKAVSDAPQVDSVDTESKAEPKKDSVGYETYSRVLAEAKKVKDKNKELEAKVQQIEELKLKEQNQWKVLYEQNKAQLDQVNSVLAEKDETIKNTVKLIAFKKYLNGDLVDDSFLDRVPFDKIAINPETNQVDADSAKQASAEFEKRFPFLVKFGQQGKIPNVAPSKNEASFNMEKPLSKDEIKKAMASVLGKQ